jgi:3-oxoacyl-[acyl-carrier protein] reductase
VHVQGKPLAELSLAEFEAPIHAYARSQFVIAKAVTRPMLERGGGVLLVLSTPAARRGFAGVLGFGATCGAIEALTRHLACELGPRGVRVVCLRPDAIPETLDRGSHAREVFQPIADRAAQVGSGGMVNVASAASSATTASTSARRQASMKRSTTAARAQCGS